MKTSTVPQGKAQGILLNLPGPKATGEIRYIILKLITVMTQFQNSKSVSIHFSRKNYP
jgi:hypothetical protein